MRKYEITGVPPKSLSANKTKLSPSFVVSQFQYLEWKHSTVPDDTGPMIEMIEKVEKVQLSSGNKAITVMCK